MMRSASIAFALVAGTVFVSAGPPQVSPAADAAAPAFEVVSVKPRVGERPLRVGPASPDRFSRPDTTLLPVVQYAYNMAGFQVIGGPGWLTSTRFEIEAKAPAKPSADQMRLMVRRLLAERFQLKAHTEVRELPTYALVMARRDGRLGPELRPSSVDCVPFLTGLRPMNESPQGANGFPLCALSFRTGRGLITMILNGIPMAQLARHLQPRVLRMVVDKTGLAGNFDLSLTSVMDPIPGIPALPGAQPPPDGPAIFTALQEQLGLKLESERGPTEVLVIDSVEPPMPD